LAPNGLLCVLHRIPWTGSARNEGEKISDLTKKTIVARKVRAQRIGRPISRHRLAIWLRWVLLILAGGAWLAGHAQGIVLVFAGGTALAQGGGIETHQ
jgi:hypothetical protein